MVSKAAIAFQEEIEPAETENGEDFIAWLKEALESGKITSDAVNSQIFHIEGDKLLFIQKSVHLNISFNS